MLEIVLLVYDILIKKIAVSEIPWNLGTIEVLDGLLYICITGITWKNVQ